MQKLRKGQKDTHNNTCEENMQKLPERLKSQLGGILVPRIAEEMLLGFWNRTLRSVSQAMLFLLKSIALSRSKLVK